MNCMQFNETDQQVKLEFKDVSYFSSGEGGTTDHSNLINRDVADQHPMSAITGLEDALSGKQPTGNYLTEEQDPTVPEWAKQPQKPAYTAQEVGALPDTTHIPTALSELSEDATHRVVTDAEKAAWNAKSNFSGSYNDLTDKPTIPGAYTLPIASSTQLGGVQPVAKTDAMTQSVGVDAAGGLWAVPGSGGGGAEREWTMLGEIDISAVGGGNIELTDLGNFTEFYTTWENVMNESTTGSGYGLFINGISIAPSVIPIQKTGASSSYGWMIARYNGLVWKVQRSGGAISKNNVTLNINNALFPYNLLLDVGKATKFQLSAPLPQYQAVSGIIKIYGR